MYYNDHILICRYTYSADTFSLGALFFAMHTRYVTQDGDKDILAPYVECDGKQQTLSVMIRRGKMSKSVIRDKHFTSFPELGDVVYAMLNEEPDRRPGMISVVSDIAELKGSLKVGHSYLT